MLRARLEVNHDDSMLLVVVPPKRARCPWAHGGLRHWGRRRRAVAGVVDGAIGGAGRGRRGHGLMRHTDADRCCLLLKAERKEK